MRDHCPYCGEDGSIDEDMEKRITKLEAALRDARQFVQGIADNEYPRRDGAYKKLLDAIDAALKEK